MRIRHFAESVVIFVAAGAILAACSSGFPLASTSATRVQSTARGAFTRSWMAKGAASTALLYLSDFGTGDVYVYSWPKLVAMGTLTGFSNPVGECVDKAQNIWIVDEGAQQVVEYAHGGTSPIATLSETGYVPSSCAVDKRTGALAVSNIGDTKGGSGGITVYRKAKGTGRVYIDSAIRYVYFLDYDRHGRLFLDGLSANGVTFGLASFKRGAFTPITVSGGTINYPGGVQFARGSLAVDDERGSNGYSVIYQISKAGVITGSTPMTQGKACVQTFIHKRAVVCPDASGPNYQIYKYPAGGTPKKMIAGSFSSPFGAAISL